LIFSGNPSDHTEDGLKFSMAVRVLNCGGSCVCDGDEIKVNNADSIVLLITAATNYVQCYDQTYNFFSNADPVKVVLERLEKAENMGYDQLLLQHIADYDGLFGRVELEFEGVKYAKEKDTAELLEGYRNDTNTDVENRYLETVYYQFGRYLLIASSRFGSLPANLQGVWSDHLSAPWNADYHANINVQMNYWHCESTNLLECHMPVINLIKTAVPRGREVAEKFFCKQDGADVRGWTMPHENNIWGHGGACPYYQGGYFPAAAGWMCLEIWEHYLFTKDKQFLLENFDIMRDAALFWVDNLWTDSRDGSLVANPSFSPEHGPYSLGCSCDQEIIWELFEAVKMPPRF
jgi:alpha-L-fucosidase 2